AMSKRFFSSVPFGKVNGCKIRSLLVISYAPDFKILKAQNGVTESLMVLVFNSCCHANNIAPFLITKPITLVIKLFNPSNNIATSIVLLK
ncbi:hypothetical protein AB6V52_28420, partial [Klebsiella pneumoniae]|uniref:hypothetical protein n=1 Tax=Klebsiella pneumoniae TaxID=573 RepID=UPI0034E2CC79